RLCARQTDAGGVLCGERGRRGSQNVRRHRMPHVRRLYLGDLPCGLGGTGPMTTALLLSGGMDSAAMAWWKHPDLAITIDYGQLAAEAELRASAAICHELGIRHSTVRVDCRALGSGDMAGQPADAHAPASDWWPYRNQMLITFAAMRCIALGATQLL